MAKRLNNVDELTLPDHFWLRAEDTCLYYGNYLRGRGYEGEVNNLIQNLKKSPLRSGLAEYRYKLSAITQAATILRGGINREAFQRCTFVPVPPSKTKGHEEFDDRMHCIAKGICDGNDGEVREMVVQTESYEASHTSDRRQRPDDLVAIYDVDTTSSPRELVVVVDDVLTTGAHFVAMKRVITSAYPGSRVIGLFVARRQVEHPNECG